MSVETLQRPLTPTLDPASRISPPTELHKLDYQSLELQPNLVINSELEKAGYDVRMEMGRLIRDTNTFLKEGKSLREAVSMAAGELEVNLRSYNLEIIKSRPILPHLNRFDEKNGSLRMVGNSGEPVVDAISAKERKGSVLAASKAIESFLFSAQDNSFAVLMNPAGWNGFVDEYGREAEPHLNAETMIFWKDQKGNLKGLTLVTDLNQTQSAAVMRSLGVSEQVLGGDSEEDRLVNIVRNPALLVFPRSDINPFEDVLEKMFAVRGYGDFRLRMRDGTTEIRSIEEVRSDIKRFEELLLFSLEEERLVTEPKQFILENLQRLGEKSIQQEIVDKIEKAILMLTRKHLQNTSKVASFTHDKTPRRWEEQETRDNFSMEMAFLKTRAGCPASIATRILGGVSLGTSVSGESLSLGSDQYGSLEFECPKCKRINSRPRGKLVPNCQHCKADVRC